MLVGHPKLEDKVIDAGFDVVLTLPCSILTQWYRPDNKRLKTLSLSREEEGVGLAAGLLAGGRSPLLMIQNSGLGNCINALGSLGVAYHIPISVLVSMRGDELDDNPVQGPLGEAAVPLIEALKCNWDRVESDRGVTQQLVALRELACLDRRPRFLLLPRREALC